MIQPLFVGHLELGSDLSQDLCRALHAVNEGVVGDQGHQRYRQSRGGSDQRFGDPGGHGLRIRYPFQAEEIEGLNDPGNGPEDPKQR